MNSTIDIVINKCYGGFGLSPEALLWLYNNGERENAIPVDEFFSKATELKAEQLKEWRAYLESKEKGFILTVFSPDEKYVLSQYDISRTSKLLIECIRVLGKKANGEYAELKIVSIPSNIDYYIHDYDGMESVEENHASWG